MELIKDIIYGTEKPKIQKLDLCLSDSEDADVFIYFHGGGLVNGSKDNCTSFDRLVAAGKAVLYANYRKYPDAAFPEIFQ